MMTTLKIEDIVVEGRKPSGQWFPIVHEVSAEARPGKVTALIGESGAGKTTVALVALGYSRPGTRIVQGHAYLGDVDILTLNREQRREIRGVRVAYVAQSASASLNPAIPLGEQVAEGLSVHGISTAESGHDRVLELFKLLDLPHPESIFQRYPHQVSGGQQQRVMIAMAMACMPEFLILDEPTTALDVTTQIEVLKAVKDVIREKGTGAIYVSHDLSVVAQVADQIVVLYGGKTVEIGQTEEMLENPRESYTRDLLEAVRVVPKNLDISNKREKIQQEGKPPVLQLKDIRASYEKQTWFHPVPEERHILRGIDFSVYPGEVVALVGESGSGKSTIAKVIAGLLPQLAGDVIFEETALRPSARKRPLDQMRKIQIVFQSPDTSLNPERHIEYSIGRPLELYFGLKGRKKRERIKELLTMVEIPPHYADRYPSELSGGQKQRVSLARAFGADPDLILCDEVLSALDNLVGMAVLNLIKELQAKLKVACLFISHDLATVATIADNVVVLYAGRICEAGPTEKVFSPPYHPYTALLMSSVPELRCGWLENVVESRLALKGIQTGAAPMDCGCAFRNRCLIAKEDICDLETPAGKYMGEDHVIYCHQDISMFPKQ
jgi:peptide/nickel transport system ATP-binding protein